MPDADFRSTAVSGKPILTSDLMFGANPLEPDLAQAATADTLAEIIQTIFENPPATLTPAQLVALRTLLEVLSVAGVESRSGSRRTCAVHG